jgi:uncharacterized membrane protein YdbT with pleckstrin-like domain
MLTEKIQLETDEVVLIQVRKHWFVLFVQVCGIAFGALCPLLLYAVFTSISLPEMVNVTIDTPSLIGTYALWLLLMWMAAFNIWTNYYLDVWTITSRRIIAVDQRGLFRRSIASFRLDRLQDINVEINGLIATFLNYGKLRAQTASGSDDEFLATGLPDPRELKSIILKATDELMRRYRGSPAENA